MLTGLLCELEFLPINSKRIESHGFKACMPVSRLLPASRVRDMDFPPWLLSPQPDKERVVRKGNKTKARQAVDTRIFRCHKTRLIWELIPLPREQTNHLSIKSSSTFMGLIFDISITT